MAKYRNNLPMLNSDIFLTDGGLETTLIFHNTIELPEFAAFVLLYNPHGQEVLKAYYQSYINLAKKYKVHFILESPTWRANLKWGKVLGYTNEQVKEANFKAIELLEDIRFQNETNDFNIVISGCLGPKGDGYVVEEKMTPEESKTFHINQISYLKETNADLVTAFTISYIDEALGIVQAAKTLAIPIVIGFTLETDGKLPSGESLNHAIETVDNLTHSYPVYYMVNCVHPLHFKDILDGNEKWKERIQAIRANASKKSHAQLDESEDLDEGNPFELAELYKHLKKKLKKLNVFGGCCGTNHHHAESILKKVLIS